VLESEQLDGNNYIELVKLDVYLIYWYSCLLLLYMSIVLYREDIENKYKCTR
jgi:hypothetical protein